jgi:two-component system, NtrC family, sensor kinase
VPGRAIIIKALRLSVILLLVGFGPVVFAEDDVSAYFFDNLLLLTIVVFVLLVLTISSLQRSRLKHKVAERNLKKIRRDLEQRVAERTERLGSLNAKLYDEISKHEITEELLRQTQDHLHSIVNAMPSIIIGVTPQLLITHWNVSAEAASQVSAASALGLNLNDVYPDHVVPPSAIELAIEKGLAQDCKNVQHSEGSHTQFSDITVYPLKSGDKITGAVIRIDDVTHRVQLENMMVQNEKMMSLGELAAGMAHEINNPLSAVVQGAQNIQRRLSGELAPNNEAASALGTSTQVINQYMEQRGILHFLANIREAGERAADIVKHMLEFSRYNNRTHSAIDLTVLLDHCLALASNSFQLESTGFESIEIIKSYPTPPIPKVNCAGVEIQQVILNILRNAAQALVSDPGEQSEPSRIEVLLRSENNHAFIEIADNGTGMPEPVRRHIFEPFYTTKEVGKGTGLGLSVSYFIITKHHHGTIDVMSAPNKGTRFIIKLPF